MAVIKDYQILAAEMRLGIREIARRANLHPATISAIMHNDGRSFFAKETQKRVHAIIEDEARRLQRALHKLMGED